LGETEDKPIFYIREASNV